VTAEELRDDLLDAIGEMLRGVEDRIVGRVLAEIRGSERQVLAPERRELIAALVATMDQDLTFRTHEVFDHAALDARLADALKACRATSTNLGAILREIARDMDAAAEGVRLVRDGRGWRLSCT